MAYAAESLALATLELLVHADPTELPDDLVAVAVDLPDDASSKIVREPELPNDWRGHPPPPALADLGTAWIQRGKELLLLVPSAVVPQERCVLINPAHRDFARARIADPVPFSLDPRIRR